MCDDIKPIGDYIKKYQTRVRICRICIKCRELTRQRYKRKKEKKDGKLIRSECTKCPHGKRRYGCRECGGRGICIHNKYRHGCRECGNYKYVKKDKCNRKKKDDNNDTNDTIDNNETNNPKTNIKTITTQCNVSELCKSIDDIIKDVKQLNKS